MKKILCLAVGLLALNLTPVFGQQNPKFGQPNPNGPELQIAIAQADAAAKQSLTKFNLDFPGGTPSDLVKAIEKAMSKPLNAIIPTEAAGIRLPPLKMNDVTTPQLFSALEKASVKDVAVVTGTYYNSMGAQNSYSTSITSYGFKTSDSPITDSSIWYFHAEKPSFPPANSTEKICRFYSLSRYLDRGFTVDDITTAIQTGWRMTGVNPPPELNYHKETKLLIAYGEPNNLNIIQSVLDSLPSSNATRTELDHMNSQISQLQDQLKKIPMPPPPAPGWTEEKTGK